MESNEDDLPTASERRRELHLLVERNFLGHKMEISDFCSGHLNENHLWKPPKQGSKNEPSWENSKKPPVVLKEAVIFDSPSAEEKEKELSRTVGCMNDRLADFTLGIDYTVPGRLPNLNKSNESPREKQLTKVLNRDDQIVHKDLYTETPRTSVMSRARDDIVCKKEEGSRKESLVDRKILVEELPANNHLTPLHSARIDEVEKLEDTVHNTTINDGSKFYLLEPTRTKQYKNLLAYRNNVVREKETCETAMMSGYKSVEHLERKLKVNLERLGENANVPNFHRLQVFAEIFDDLSHDSPLFGPILHEIKLYYDRYISDLLDSAPPQHHLLSNEVNQLLSSGIVQPGAVEEAQEILHNVENKILMALENERKFKKELEICKSQVVDMQSIMEGRIQAVMKANNEKNHVLTEAEEVEQLKADCWKMFDNINDIREKLNKDYTPVAICAHFDQCCQEAEVEVQQLKQEKSNFLKDINRMEEELTSLLRECDMPERVEKQIWSLVDNPKSVHNDPDNDNESIAVEQVSHEDKVENENDAPWRWYIS